MDFSDNVGHCQTVSYLRARDPSILACNRPFKKINLNFVQDSDSDESKENTRENNTLQIYLRVNGRVQCDGLYEIVDQTTFISKAPGGSHALRNAKTGNGVVTRKFSFSKIFGPSTTQLELFDSVIKPKLLNFINGSNSTLLTYGASGSGKTFTIVGSADHPGIIPRALEYLFRTLPTLSEIPTIKPLPHGGVSKDVNPKEEQRVRLDILQASLTDLSQDKKDYSQMKQRLSDQPVAFLELDKDVTLGVWVSFAEIYNENVYDLLAPDPPRGKPRNALRLANFNGFNYIRDLTSVNVRSGIEAYQIMKYGIHKLNYAETKINNRSSRSHSIFTIKLAQASNSESGVHVSYFNFCDLAGSERLKKTMNVGERLKESKNINTSLLVLGRCISNIRNDQKSSDNKLIPFRESKLTQLFQSALSGFEDISMIVNITSAKDMFDETQHVLNFSAIAKDIILEKPTSRFEKPSRFSRYLQGRSTAFETIQENEDYWQKKASDLEDELEDLRFQCEQQQRNEQELVGEYKELLADQDKRSKDLQKQIKDNLIMKHKSEMKILRRQYETELAKAREEVILIDDSDEESVDFEKNSEIINSLKQTIEEQKEVIENQTRTIAKLKEELFEVRRTSDEKKIRFLKLKADLLWCEEQRKELELTLEDAKVEFKSKVDDLNRILIDFEELKQANVELEDKNAFLENELESFRNRTQSELSTRLLEDTSMPSFSGCRQRESDLDLSPKDVLESSLNGTFAKTDRM